jgi:cation transport regulator ChaC
VIQNVPGTLDLHSGESAIFGYGSLLCQASMERTTRRPYTRGSVVAQLPGWRRVWDALIPNQTFYFRAANGERCIPEHIAYLNIRPGTATVNGLLYALTPEELAALDEREEGYDRLDVNREVTGATVTGGPVYVYVARPDRLQVTPQPKERVAIRASYLAIIENGLTALGQEFRAAYDRSTDAPPRENVIADLRDDPPAR